MESISFKNFGDPGPGFGKMIRFAVYQSYNGAKSLIWQRKGAPGRAIHLRDTIRFVFIYDKTYLYTPLLYPIIKCIKCIKINKKRYKLRGPVPAQREIHDTNKCGSIDEKRNPVNDLSNSINLYH